MKNVSGQYIGILALLIGTLAANGLTARRVPQSLVTPLEQIDSNIAGWSAYGDGVLQPGTLKALGASSYLVRNYRKGNMGLELFVAFYAQQRAGESMHSPKHCLPGAGWEIWQEGSTRVKVGGEEININEYSIENLGAKKRMFYWYQSRNQVIASEYFGKLLLARDTLMSGQTSGSIVRIILPDTPGASTEGAAFASELIPAVWRCFGRERLP